MKCVNSCDHILASQVSECLPLSIPPALYGLVDSARWFSGLHFIHTDLQHIVILIEF